MKNYILLGLIISIILLAGCKQSVFQESRYEDYTDFSKCPAIAQELILKYNVDTSSIYFCDVYEFESVEDSKLIHISYNPESSRYLPPKSLIKLKVGEKELDIEDTIFSTGQINWRYSEENLRCSFPYGDWIRNVRNNKEIDWDLVEKNDEFFFKIIFDDFVYPTHIDKKIYEYSDWEVRVKGMGNQCTINGFMNIRIDLTQSEVMDKSIDISNKLDLSNLKITTSEIPIK